MASGGASRASAQAMSTTSGTSSRRRIGVGGSICGSRSLSARGPRHLREVGNGGRVRTFDAATYLILATITELAQTGSLPLAPARQHVHLDAWRHRGHPPVEPVRPR